VKAIKLAMKIVTSAKTMRRLAMRAELFMGGLAP
jgi:hypothetical protein